MGKESKEAGNQTSADVDQSGQAEIDLDANSDNDNDVVLGQCHDNALLARKKDEPRLINKKRE